MSRRQTESGVNGSPKASAAAMLVGMLCLSALADLSLPPTPAVTNGAPLLRTPFVALQLGSVRAQGWLLKQCELQRDGLTGRAEELYPDDLGPNSAWLGGAGEAWERGPYYVKGLVALAYTLNDAALKQKAQKWIEWLLGHQRADGYIGPAHNDDWWPRMVATYALKDYYEATGDARVPPVLSDYFHYMLGQLPSHPLADWAKSRAGDEMEVALWLYNRNGDTSLLSLVQLLRRQAYDWPGIFSSEDTAYPFEEQVRLRISTEEPVAFPLELRIPGWCNNPSVSVNGRAERNVKTGSFHRLQRTWKSGDTVVVNLPMLIQTQMGRSLAISRGPLVYSLRIGEDWSVRKHDPARFDEFEVRPTTPWNYALQLDPANPASDIAVQNDGTPANPFDPAEPSVALRAKARQLPDWTIGWRGTHAFEPPVSPVASTNPLTDVVLVPFGSRHLRVSWFPILGTAQPAAGEFSETFDSTWPQRWTVFGGNWLASGGALSSVPASANGAKALAMATAFTNFIFEADVSVGPAGDAGLVFRVSKPDIGANAYCGYYAGISANARKLVFGCASNAWREIASAPAEFVANGRCHLKVVAQGAHFQIYLGDKPEPLIEARDGSFSSDMVGVRDYCTDEKQSLSTFANVKATETCSVGLNRYSVP